MPGSSSSRNHWRQVYSCVYTNIQAKWMQRLENSLGLTPDGPWSWHYWHRNVRRFPQQQIDGISKIYLVFSQGSLPTEWLMLLGSKLPRYFSREPGSILRFFSSCLSCWGSAGNRSPQPLKGRWRTLETCFAPLSWVSKGGNRHKPEVPMEGIKTTATQYLDMAPIKSLEKENLSLPLKLSFLLRGFEPTLHVWSIKLHLHHRRAENQAHIMKILNWEGIVPWRG